MKSLKEITEQITHNENCKELIERLTRKFEGHDYDAWNLNKQIDHSHKKLSTLSIENLKLESEREAMSAMGDDGGLQKLIMSHRLEGVQIKKENVSPDAMVFPLFQLHLITSQRVVTEEFVESLQKRLKKLSGDTGKTQKTKPTTNKGRHKKAA